MEIAWVFPGQGSQMVGMGRDLYTRVPAARQVFDEADAVLDMPLTRLCFEGPEQTLTATDVAQPALLTMSMAVLRSLHTLGDADSSAPAQPGVLAGHSLGEYSALVAGGALSLPTALRLVRRRGELMAAAREGTMAAVMGLETERLEALCRTVAADLHEPVVVANYNAPGQLVISGTAAAVAHAGTLARQQGARRVLPLRVSAAFHSPLMQPVAHGMHDALTTVPIADLRVPLMSNVSAAPLVRADDVRHELIAQVTAPVQWIASVQHMVARGCSTFIELGAGCVLTGLIKRIAPGVRVINLRDADDMQAFLAQHTFAA